jgi:hypothetical protein
MNTKTTTLILSVLMTGCSSIHWVKPGEADNEAQRRKDQYECQYQANMQAGAQTLAYGSIGAAGVFELAKECMAVRGYTFQW